MFRNIQFWLNWLEQSYSYFGKYKGGDCRKIENLQNFAMHTMINCIQITIQVIPQYTTIITMQWIHKAHKFLQTCNVIMDHKSWYFTVNTIPANYEHTLKYPKCPTT